jgi:hypothetical protein
MSSICSNASGSPRGSDACCCEDGFIYTSCLCGVDIDDLDGVVGDRAYEYVDMDCVYACMYVCMYVCTCVDIDGVVGDRMYEYVNMDCVYAYMYVISEHLFVNVYAFMIAP